MYKHHLLLYDNFPHFNILESHEPPSDLVIKLHCIIIICKINLYTFLTIQLCMCSMERQERKIHQVTMINCSTMLLAGLCFWFIILSNGWLWSGHCLQYTYFQWLTLESYYSITKNKYLPKDSYYCRLVTNNCIDCQGMIITCFSTLSYPVFSRRIRTTTSSTTTSSSTTTTTTTTTIFIYVQFTF